MTDDVQKTLLPLSSCVYYVINYDRSASLRMGGAEDVLLTCQKQASLPSGSGAAERQVGSTFLQVQESAEISNEQHQYAARPVGH